MQAYIDQNRRSWNKNAKHYFSTTALPTYGCHLPTEESLNLFEDIKGKKILEVAFGSGHSLKYLMDKEAGELWGIDLSDVQKKTAYEVLGPRAQEVRLMTSSMEENPGLPLNHFDIVFSIYGLGWTMDLKKTLKNIASYLNVGGILIFSWDHPLLSCVDQDLQFTGNYHEDDVFSWEKDGQKLTVINRKFSTYINALSQAGFMVDRVIETLDESSEAVGFASSYYSQEKLRHFPLSFIIKARKI